MGTLPSSGSTHRWFPAVVTNHSTSTSKGHLAAETWRAQVGSNHRLIACKAEQGRGSAQAREVSSSTRPARLARAASRAGFGARTGSYGVCCGGGDRVAGDVEAPHGRPVASGAYQAKKGIREKDAWARWMIPG